MFRVLKSVNTKRENIFVFQYRFDMITFVTSQIVTVCAVLQRIFELQSETVGTFRTLQQTARG